MNNRITLAHLTGFDELIDVRTPAEFALDHIPGAHNYPVLSDAERAEVGTVYVQESEFAGRRLGAAYIARNIASHLERHLADRPRDWRPLVYCWRGGKRSGAMHHILRQVGWRAEKLEGGYKAWRQTVHADMALLPGQFRYRVLCGLTGSGKSRVLEKLAALGAQVLDLEACARHRGSLLGSLPDTPQPGQKMFEGLLWTALQCFDPARPVYVEAESKRIGSLRVPPALIEAMWRPGQCIRLASPDSLRTELLRQDYQHFLQQPQLLTARLDFLLELHGHQQLEVWQRQIEQQQWDTFIADLLHRHYDRSYNDSMRRHYADFDTSPEVRLTGLDDASLTLAARQILDLEVRSDMP